VFVALYTSLLMSVHLYKNRKPLVNIFIHKLIIPYIFVKKRL